MKFTIKKAYDLFVMKCGFMVQRRLLKDERGFGMNELLGIAAALIIAGFVVVPGLRRLAQSIMNGLEGWWKDTIVAKIFQPS